MNYYDMNMECMKQHDIKLYEKILEDSRGTANNMLEQISSHTAKDGNRYLEVVKDGRQYRLNSSYSPEHEAEIWCEQYTFVNMNTVVTLYGFGNGSFVRELLNKKDDNDILFIYEPCMELFLHVLNNYNITDILKHERMVLILEGINEIEFHNLLRETVNITNISSQFQCIHPFYDDVFPEGCINYWKEIKDNYYYVITSINTEIVFGKRYITNSIYNTRFIKNSYIWMDLKDEFNLEVPAIIVAAGPSLKRNIEELRRAKGKSYIFVVDRILDYILDQGVQPDYIVTVDPIKPIEYFTKRTDVDIPLLCIPVANWEVLERHQGKKIIYCSSQFYYKMYKELDKEPPLLDTGASVATAVFSACLQMGFKRIVLIGQDLAYDGDETHAFGAPEKGAADRILYVEGMDGNKVRTRHDWYEFLTWFKTTVELNPQVEVIDVKDRGAKIKGTISMPMEEVLDKYCSDRIVKTNVIEGKDGAFNEADMARVKKFFDDSLEEAYSLKKKAKEAIKLCESQIKDYSNNPEENAATSRRYKQISKINKFIEEQQVYSLMDSYITALSAEYISKLYKFSDNADTDKVATYEKASKIFEAIIEAADFVKPVLEEAIKHI